MNSTADWIASFIIDHIKDQTDAFYTLDESGELQPLNYDEHIKDHADLWTDDES